MIYMAIDPGEAVSGVVWFDGKLKRVLESQNKAENAWVNSALVHHWHSELVLIEGVSPRGLALGWSTVKTIEWCGRFYESARRQNIAAEIYYRDDIKRQLMGRSNVPSADSKIAQHVRNQLGEKGTKKNPGPCYGVAGHAWQALAIVVAYMERNGEL